MVQITRASYSTLANPVKRCIKLMQDAERAHQLALIGLRSLTSIRTEDVSTSLDPFVYSLFSGFLPDRQRINSRGPISLQRLRRDLDETSQSLAAQAAVGLWTAMELLIEDFSVAWIKNAAGPFAEIQIKSSAEFKVADFGTPEALAHALALTYWKSEFKHKGKPGAITRFEHWQKAFGISTTLAPKRIIETIVELEAVRHIVVHRNSIVDDNFKKVCPSPSRVPELVGQPFLVTEQRLSKYQQSVWSYIQMLAARVRSVAPEVVNA